jgi:hypothetical protein
LNSSVLCRRCAASLCQLQPGLTLLLQIPHWRDHGLQPEDPNDKFSVKGKSLKDMGKDNHDLSAFLRLVACILFLFPPEISFRFDSIGR